MSNYIFSIQQPNLECCQHNCLSPPEFVLSNWTEERRSPKARRGLRKLSPDLSLTQQTRADVNHLTKSFFSPMRRQGDSPLTRVVVRLGQHHWRKLRRSGFTSRRYIGD